jgi:hypothetical protein
MGFGMARTVLWLSLLVFPLHSANAAMDGPNDYLKGIKIISYDIFVNPTIGGKGCSIDRDNLNTSVQFVANQSTKLKIVTFDERFSRSGEPFSRSDVTSLSNADKEAAEKARRDYTLMPSFVIEIMPLQTRFECAGTIHAKLSAYFEEPAYIIPNNVRIAVPMFEIWATIFGFVGPQQTFSTQAINLTEQIMKQLVNDWAASQ